MALQDHSPELETRVREHLQTWHDTMRLNNPEAFWEGAGYESLELLRRRLGIKLKLRLGGGRNEVKVQFANQSGAFPITNAPWPYTIGDYVLHL